MTLHQLKELVSKGESWNLEFKRKVGEAEKIVRELIALANSKGGILLLGVDDDLSIPGLKFPEDEVTSLNHAIKSFARPRLNYTFEEIPISKKRAVVLYRIPESRRKPHYIFKNRRKYTYIRKEDRTIRASREMVNILKKEAVLHGEHIQLGEIEMSLLRALKKKRFITIKEFCELADVNRRLASDTLITLVSSGVLRIDPGEIEDRYFTTELG